MISKNIFTYIILILFSPLIGKLLRCILDYYKSYKNLHKNITLEDALSRITQREFEIWCSEYLIHKGFDNIILPPIESKDTTIIGNKSNDKYYIKCKKYDKNHVIDINEIELLLGSMIYNNFKFGLLITTGTIPNSVNEFVKNLKSPYKIDIISSKELNCSYSDYILAIN